MFNRAGAAGAFSAACTNTDTGKSQQVGAPAECVQTRGPGRRMYQHGLRLSLSLAEGHPSDQGVYSKPAQST